MADTTGSDDRRKAKAGSDADADLLRVARKRFDLAWEADRTNRDEALDDLKFLAGEQWPAELVAERKADERPVHTENVLPQFVEQIVGDIRQQRPAIKVRPVDDQADPKVADVMTGLIRDIEGFSAETQPYVRAAENAVRCGIGHFRILTDYTRLGAFEQDIKLEPIENPFAVVWDPLARDVTRADARFCFVTEVMDRDEFKAAYPDAAVVDFDGAEIDDQYANLGNWYEADGVRVAEYFWKERAPKRFARFSSGEIVELEDGEADPPGVEVREFDAVKVCWAKISGLAVLDRGEWLTDDIPIIPVIGKEINIGDRVVRAGAIRFAKDPQLRHNYWVTTQTELMALQPKAPFLATPAHIKGFEELWREANTKNRPVLLFNPDSGAPTLRPERQAPPMASGGFTQEIVRTMDAMKSATGVYEAALGAPSDEKSGVAIAQRKQQTGTTSYVFTDNLKASVARAARILIDLIPKIYDSERVVRLLNEDESQAFERVNVVLQSAEGPIVHNDLTVGRYDLVVSTGPAYATRRQEALDGMMELLGRNPQQAALVMDLIVKNQDWPGADEFVERLRKTLPPNLRPKDEEPSPEAEQEQAAAQQQAQMQAHGQELAMREQDAKVRKAEAEAVKAEAEAKMVSGELNQMVEQAVMAVLARMAPPPTGPVAPMPLQQ